MRSLQNIWIFNLIVDNKQGRQKSMVFLFLISTVTFLSNPQDALTLHLFSAFDGYALAVKLSFSYAYEKRLAEISTSLSIKLYTIFLKIT